MTVTPLSRAAVTPELLLNHIQDDVTKIEEIYIVAFHKDGTIHEHVAGKASGMTLAAAVLTQSALEHIEG